MKDFFGQLSHSSITLRIVTAKAPLIWTLVITLFMTGLTLRLARPDLIFLSGPYWQPRRSVQLLAGGGIGQLPTATPLLPCRDIVLPLETATPPLPIEPAATPVLLETALPPGVLSR